MADYRRARWGLRRTFQTEQAIEQLSVFDNVAMIYEHSGVKGAGRRAEVQAAIDFVGLETPARARVGGLGARERRLVEVARAVVGNPRIVLLDEPAAGLPDEETEHLSSVIQAIPDRFGALVDARRPRHEPRPGLLRDDRRARLREAHRVRPDGRGAPRRARDPRVSRHRGRRVSTVAAPRSALHALVRRALGRPRRPCRCSTTCRSRCLRARSPRCSGRTAPGSRRSSWRSAACSAPPRGRSLLGELDLTRRRPEQIRAAGVAIVPEGRQLLPQPHRRGEPPRRDVRAQARRGAQRDRVRARAVPGAREADAHRRHGRSRAASSRWSSSRRRSSPGRR